MLCHLILSLNLFQLRAWAADKRLVTSVARMTQLAHEPGFT